MNKEAQKQISKRMKVIKAEMEWTVKDLQALLGSTNVSSVKNKLNGYANWTLSDVLKVANETGFSLDYVCGRSEYKKFLVTTDGEK